ncbi:MAG: hypothetical protein ACKPGO_24430, partial [Microcystis panniformis]
RQEPEKDIYQKSHDQARGLKTERVPIIFIHKYFTQFIPGKQEGYATNTESLPFEPIIFIHKYFTQFIPGKQEGYATTTKSLTPTKTNNALG